MKAMKIAQLVGFLVLAIGVIIRAGAGEYYGTFIALIGVLIYAVARVAAWMQSDKP